jgi:hypothetical protein
MTNKTQPMHTKGELKVGRKLHIQVNPENPLHTINICHVMGGDEEAAANAARIVKCWNMHDELVEALKLALANLRTDARSTKDVIQNMIKQAEQK